MYDEQIKQILEKTDYVIKQKVTTAAEIEKKEKENAPKLTDEQIKELIMNDEDLSVLFKKAPSKDNAYLKNAQYIFYLIARNEYGKSPFVSYIWTTFSFRFRMFYQFLLPGRSVNREIIKEYIKLAIEHPYKSFGMGYLKALTLYIPTLSMSIYYERIIGLFYDIKLFYDMKTKDPTILDPNPNSNAFRDDFDLDATIDKYLDMI